jgi:hypothetical protein
VIRQAISCDICASEKRQTNHWFVAYEQAGELRVSGWSSRHKLRAGSKHLCGQTCLHKLVDEFMAKAIAVRAQRPVDEPVEELAPELPAVGDASLTSDSAFVGAANPVMANPVLANIELESSARIITAPAIAPPSAAQPGTAYRPQSEVVPRAPAPPLPLLPRPAYRPQPELVPPLPHPVEYVASPEESPRFASRNWRAEAWERERERELRAMGKHPGITTRRASNA